MLNEGEREMEIEWKWLIYIWCNPVPVDNPSASVLPVALHASCWPISSSIAHPHSLLTYATETTLPPCSESPSRVYFWRDLQTRDIDERGSNGMIFSLGACVTPRLPTKWIHMEVGLLAAPVRIVRMAQDSAGCIQQGSIHTTAIFGSCRINAAQQKLSY